MATRELVLLEGCGLGAVEALNEASEPVLRLLVDASNIVEADSPGTENLVLMRVDGELRLMPANAFGGSQGLPYEKSLTFVWGMALTQTYVANNALLRRIPAVLGKTNVVRRLTVTGVANLLGVTGASQFRFANMLPDDSEDEAYVFADVTLPEGAYYSDPVVCAIPLVDGYLYGWPITAGGHGAPVVQADAEVSG